jgi:hypothetical protein
MTATETQYTLSATKLKELAYLIAGATTAVFMAKSPDMEMPVEEVKVAVLSVLSEFGYDAVGVDE